MMKKKSIAIDLFVSILVNKTKTSRKTTWKKKEHTQKTTKETNRNVKKRGRCQDPFYQGLQGRMDGRCFG